MELSVSLGAGRGRSGRDSVASSKSETIARLEGSALKLFSEHGYDGTSLRDIANHAQVPLSTIDRYFGSKLDLFNELKSSIWKRVSNEREALMRHPVETDESGKPTLDAVLYAFVYPVVRRGIGEERAPGTLRLLREYVAMSVHTVSTNAPDFIAGVANRWLVAIMEARPTLPRDRAVWLLSFVVMVTFNEQMQHGWYDALLPADSQISAEELTQMIVAFCRAGINEVATESHVMSAPAAVA
jgi:AcrR family transcriptional regulator